MKRYDLDVGYPSHLIVPHEHGDYVLASEAMAEIDRLRGLVCAAFGEGVNEGWYHPDAHLVELWEQSEARKSLTPHTPTPNP